MNQTKMPSSCRQASEEDSLVCQYLPAIWKMALQVYQQHPRHAFLEVEDLVQIGVVAAMKAEKVYAPDRGTTFFVFAKKAIRGAMIDMYRRGKLESLRLSEQAGLCKDIERKIDKRVRTESRPDSNPEEVAQKAELSDLVDKALNRLNPAQRRVVMEIYYNAKSKSACAREMGIHPSSLGEIHQAALDNLRATLCGLVAHSQSSGSLGFSVYEQSVRAMRQLELPLGMDNSMGEKI